MLFIRRDSITHFLTEKKSSKQKFLKKNQFKQKLFYSSFAKFIISLRPNCLFKFFLSFNEFNEFH